LKLLSYEVLDKISSRILNEVNGVNRILFVITLKPYGKERIVSIMLAI